MALSPFWDKKLDCPVVYVAGVRIPSDDQSVRASYGICWGFKDPKNKSGAIQGGKTVLRAELSGVVRVLEIALHQKIQQLVIRTKSDELNAELDDWEQSDIEDKLRFENSDILSKMDNLREKGKDYMYWMADVAPYPSQEAKDFKWALHYATLNASGRFATTVKTPVKRVAIYGACSKEGQKNPKASFAVVWGVDDALNDTGLVEGKQTHLRAEYCALRSALRTAIDQKDKKIHVLTRNISIKLTIESFNGIETSKKPLDPIAADCKALAEKLVLTVEHIVVTVEHRELDEARTMAKQLVEPAADCNGNNKYSSAIMERLDQMIIDGDPDERYEVKIRTPRSTPKKDDEKQKPSSQKKAGTTYKQTPSGSIEVQTYQDVSNQRPLKVNGYQRADGVQVFLGRT